MDTWRGREREGRRREREGERREREREEMKRHGVHIVPTNVNRMLP